VKAVVGWILSFFGLVVCLYGFLAVLEGIYGVATTGETKFSVELRYGLVYFGIGACEVLAGLVLAGLRLRRRTPR